MIFVLIRIFCWLVLLFGMVYFLWECQWTNAILSYIALELRDINSFREATEDE